MFVSSSESSTSSPGLFVSSSESSVSSPGLFVSSSESSVSSPGLFVSSSESSVSSPGLFVSSSESSVSSPGLFVSSSGSSTGSSITTCSTVTLISLVALAPFESVTLYTTLYIPAAAVSTVFSIISIDDVIFPSSLSSALTFNIGSKSSPTLITTSSALITGTLFIIVNLGFTVTLISLVALAPFESVTLYTTLYIPAAAVSTVFSIISIDDVIFPSSLSSALTFNIGSKSSPTLITTSSALITGTLFIIVNLGFTVTLISLVALAPFESVTLYTTLYIPAAAVSTVFSIISIDDVIFPSSLSSALTFNIGSKSSPTLITTSSALITGTTFISTCL